MSNALPPVVAANANNAAKAAINAAKKANANALQASAAASAAANAVAQGATPAQAGNAAGVAASQNGASPPAAQAVANAVQAEVAKTQNNGTPGASGPNVAAAARGAAGGKNAPAAAGNAPAAQVVANAAGNAAAANGAPAPAASAAANAAGNAVVNGASVVQAANAAANAAAANGATPAQANAVANAVVNSARANASQNGAGGMSGGLSFANAQKIANAPPVADALVDPQARPADGRLGSYVPADTYLHGATLESSTLAPNLMSRPKLGAACAESDRGCTLFRGPADAAAAKPVASLFPLAIESGDGFDEVLIDSPPDLLYADQLMGEDVVSLTVTRNQTHDLRGEGAIAPIYNVDSFGVSEPGIALGAYTPDLGPYQLRKQTRQFIA